MTINWQQFEQTLFDSTVTEIGKFATDHKNERFYAFAFDCNSEYGDVLLCLNTPEALKSRAKEYSIKPPDADFWREFCAKRNAAAGKELWTESPPKPPEMWEAELRWGLGDWEHQGFESPAFERSLNRFKTAVIEACMEEEEDEHTFMTPTQVCFMDAVCRTLCRLEKANAFDALVRTEDFAVLTMDHEEDEEDAWARLNACRQAMTQQEKTK